MTPRRQTTPDTAKIAFIFRPKSLTLGDGTRVIIRSITPEDEPRMVAFHQTLSNQSVHLRYFSMLSLAFRTEHKRLAALCTTDLAHEIALVADQKRSDGKHDILGVGRLIKTPGLDEAEFAMVVTDQRQGDGLGTALLKSLVAIGRKAKIRIFAHILSENAVMLHVSRNLGFTLRLRPNEREWEAELDLRPKQNVRDNLVPA